MKAILLIHVAATLMMTGVIWIIQVVHYPLFNRVGSAFFTRYESDHALLITLIVFPLMSAEAVTALVLVIQRPEQIPPLLLYIGLALVAVAWLSTALVQVPLHQRLASTFDDQIHRSLVISNWIRTLSWTLRSLLVLWILARLIPWNSS